MIFIRMILNLERQILLWQIRASDWLEADQFIPNIDSNSSNLFNVATIS